VNPRDDFHGSNTGAFWCKLMRIMIKNDNSGENFKSLLCRALACKCSVNERLQKRRSADLNPPASILLRQALESRTNCPSMKSLPLHMSFNSPARIQLVRNKGFRMTIFIALQKNNTHSKIAPLSDFSLGSGLPLRYTTAIENYYQFQG